MYKVKATFEIQDNDGNVRTIIKKDYNVSSIEHKHILEPKYFETYSLSDEEVNITLKELKMIEPTVNNKHHINIKIES